MESERNIEVADKVFGLNKKEEKGTTEKRGIGFSRLKKSTRRAHTEVRANKTQIGPGGLHYNYLGLSSCRPSLVRRDENSICEVNFYDLKRVNLEYVVNRSKTSTVVRATTDDNQSIVVKVFVANEDEVICSPLPKSLIVESFHSEYTYLSYVAGIPHVVRLLGWGVANGNPALIMHDVGLTTLRSWLSSLEAVAAPQLQLLLRLCWAAQLTEAVDELHSRNLEHNDIKPENLMISNPVGCATSHSEFDSFDKFPTITLIDFSSATFFREHTFLDPILSHSMRDVECQWESSNRGVPVEYIRRRLNRGSTLEYASPESVVMAAAAQRPQGYYYTKQPTAVSAYALGHSSASLSSTACSGLLYDDCHRWEIEHSQFNEGSECCSESGCLLLPFEERRASLLCSVPNESFECVGVGGLIKGAGLLESLAEENSYPNNTSNNTSNTTTKDAKIIVDSKVVAEGNNNNLALGLVGASDSWSLGLVIAEIFGGEEFVPFRGMGRKEIRRRLMGENDIFMESALEVCDSLCDCIISNMIDFLYFRLQRCEIHHTSLGVAFKLSHWLRTTIIRLVRSCLQRRPEHRPTTHELSHTLRHLRHVTLQFYKNFIFPAN